MSKTSKTLDHFVDSYGDLIFDLCNSLLSSPTNAQIAFRSILKKIKSGSRFQKYSIYERSWVLRIACDRLLALSQHHGYEITPQEQIQLDAQSLLIHRLKQFTVFFHRLLPEDQILLLLKDKHGIPLKEIATAMAIPVEALKIRRIQALRSIEGWLWKQA